MLSFNGHLGNITDVSHDAAALNGLKVAQAILADEARRLALPRPVFGAPGSYVPAQG